MLTQLTLCAQAETMARSMDTLRMSITHAGHIRHVITPAMPRYSKPGKRLFRAPMRQARA